MGAPLTIVSREIAARASALIEVGRAGDAVGIVQAALASAPDDPVLLDALARAQLDTDAEAARSTSARLITGSPQSHRGYLLRSLAASRLGFHDDAARDALTAVRQAPHVAACHARLAQAVADQRGSAKSARAAARDALALEPGEAAYHVTAGNVELRFGRWRAARRHYDRALELDPGSRAAQANLATLSTSRGNLAGAFGVLQQLLRLNPSDPHARRLLDRAIYTTIVDLQWLVLAAALAVFVLRNR